MPKNDPATQTALLRGSDMALALSLLTRLPVTVGDASRGARAAWAYPLVGIVTGGLAALIGLLAMTLGLGAPIAALLAL
ncbi:MAG: adenosylcobinamide-GDP ribazoletransferase, partial [Pseudomonadota bacterium]